VAITGGGHAQFADSPLHVGVRRGRGAAFDFSEPSEKWGRPSSLFGLPLNGGLG
jgi:hypothetical protein